MSEFTTNKEKTINQAETKPNNPSVIPKVNMQLGRKAVDSNVRYEKNSNYQNIPSINQLKEPSYTESKIDWHKINSLAKHVAENTKAPQGTHSEIAEEEAERIVRYGFLGIFSRPEKYNVSVVREIPDNCWILEERNYYKEDKYGYGREEVTEIYQHCLGTNGELFYRVFTEIIYFDEKGQITNRESKKLEDANLSDSQALSLDFKPDYYEFNGALGKGIRSNMPSEELLVKTKGEGLITRLEKLLN